MDNLPLPAPLRQLRCQRSRFWSLAALCMTWLLQACASVPAPTVPTDGKIALPQQMAPIGFRLPPPPEQDFGFSMGSEIVVRAIALLGTPYRYGGNGPEAFDCSGLVRYVYNELGIDVPRTAVEQYRAAQAVDMEQLEPGDLLFFRTQGDSVSHVAIYAGSGRFVHAPQTGRSIELREIGDGYYRTRLVGAGRLFSKDSLSK
jgi:murein DD-endopeptidase